MDSLGVDSIKLRMDSLIVDAKATLRAEVEKLFAEHPIIETVSYLNGDTYDDEGYDFPSSHSYRAGDTVVVNEYDPDGYYNEDDDEYEADDYDDEVTKQLKASKKRALLAAIRAAQNPRIDIFYSLFPGWDEIRFSRSRGNGIEVRVYERSR
jgi:glycogen synthase